MLKVITGEASKGYKILIRDRTIKNMDKYAPLKKFHHNR